jgi:hypothetical protein
MPLSRHILMLGRSWTTSISTAKSASNCSFTVYPIGNGDSFGSSVGPSRNRIRSVIRLACSISSKDSDRVH